VESLLRLRPTRAAGPRAQLPRAEEWIGDG